MFDHEQTNFHVEYMDVTQHWCATSEKYAGGDCLLTALLEGWTMSPHIRRETKWFTGSRFIHVYHFVLSRDDEQMVMPVITNPFVEKFVGQPSLQLEYIEER
jgi:hypothetical protein